MYVHDCILAKNNFWTVFHLKKTCTHLHTVCTLIYFESGDSMQKHPFVLFFVLIHFRLRLRCFLTWKLFWKFGVLASPATSAPLYTNLNPCWWWAQHCTSTLTCTTPSSRIFRYGCRKKQRQIFYVNTCLTYSTKLEVESFIIPLN